MHLSSPTRPRILVTGGSRGIGLAICRNLLDAGWDVVTIFRQTSAEIDRLKSIYGYRLHCLQIDLESDCAIHTISSKAQLLHGVCGFVSNAGVSQDGLLTLVDPVAIRRCIHLNLTVPVLLTREVVKGMLSCGGSIVLISSVAGLRGLPGLAAYGAAKAGLIGFSRAVAREYGPRGIRCNCVVPGFVETDMTASLDNQQRARIIRRTAARKLANVHDIANVVTFLLSDKAKHVTGTELVVDGGFTT